MNVTEVMPAAPPQRSLRKGDRSPPGVGSTNYLENSLISSRFSKISGTMNFDESFHAQPTVWRRCQEYLLTLL